MKWFILALLMTSQASAQCAPFGFVLGWGTNDCPVVSVAVGQTVVVPLRFRQDSRVTLDCSFSGRQAMQVVADLNWGNAVTFTGATRGAGVPGAWGFSSGTACSTRQLTWGDRTTYLGDGDHEFALVSFRGVSVGVATVNFVDPVGACATTIWAQDPEPTGCGLVAYNVVSNTPCEDLPECIYEDHAQALTINVVAAGGGGGNEFDKAGFSWSMMKELYR